MITNAEKQRKARASTQAIPTMAERLQNQLKPQHSFNFWHQTINWEICLNRCAWSSSKQWLDNACNCFVVWGSRHLLSKIECPACLSRWVLPGCSWASSDSTMSWACWVPIWQLHRVADQISSSNHWWSLDQTFCGMGQKNLAKCTCSRGGELA